MGQNTFQKIKSLMEQAEVIRMLFGVESPQIWENVIIIAKQGNRSSEQYNFQAGEYILLVTSYYGETFQLNTILSEWSSSCRNALTFFWWEFAYFFNELVTRMEIASLNISSGLDSN